MRKISSYLTILVIFFILSYSLCNAEKIYRKDGNVVVGKIVSRNRCSVSLAPGYKDAEGLTEVNIRDIDRIKNEDGTISKYDYKSLYKKSQVCIEQKDYQEAVRLYSLLLESFPENTRIRYLRAILNHKLGKLNEASEDYGFLIEHNTVDADVFNNLGAIYAKNNEHRKAKDWFVKAIKEKPEMPEVHDNLAKLSMQKKDYDRAIYEYKKVIELEAGNVEALRNLGIAYVNTGNLLEAKEQWEKVLAIRPEDNHAKSILGHINAKINKVE